MSGYVRIHRKLLGHPVFRNDAEAMTFAWMVIRAAWKPARLRYKDRVLVIQRGQLAVSVRDLANAMDRDKAWIERLLKRLKNETMIETSSETGVNVVTICNYSQYQADLNDDETPAEALNETGARQGRDTEQEKEEVKKGNKIPRARVTSTTSEWANPFPTTLKQQVWLDFMTNRKRKKLPNTMTAWERLHNDLDRIANETGMKAEALIEHAAAKGWGGIYNPKGRNDDNGQENGSRNQRAAQRALDNIRAGEAARSGAAVPS